jgi:hypothetical protein
VSTGSVFQYKATATWSNGAIIYNASATWTADAPAIATIDTNGVLTANHEGAVTITPRIETRARRPASTSLPRPPPTGTWTRFSD